MKLLPAAIGLLAAVLTASAQAQQSFHFTNLDTPASIQEAVNAIRTIGDLTQVAYVATTKSVVVEGSANDLAVAAWIFEQLDQAGSRTSQTFQVPGSPDVIGLLYLAHADAHQDLLSDANVVRTILELTRVFPFAATNALLVRASPKMIEYASWLLSNIDLAGSPRASAPDVSASSDLAYGNMGESIRVLYLQPTATQQQLIDAANAVRVIPELTRVFPSDKLRAIVVRAPADKMAAAAWLATEFDSPSVDAEPLVYRMQQPDLPVVLFVPVADPGLGETKKLADDMRATLHFIRVYAGANAVVVRGTEEQVTQAQKLAADLRTGK